MTSPGTFSNDRSDWGIAPRRNDWFAWKVSSNCFWCGRHIEYEGFINEGVQATRDHLLPRSRGGDKIPPENNIVAACRRCNCERKSDIDWLPWHVMQTHPRLDVPRGQAWRRCLPGPDFYYQGKCLGFACVRCSGLGVLQVRLKGS